MVVVSLHSDRNPDLDKGYTSEAEHLTCVYAALIQSSSLCTPAGIGVFVTLKGLMET